MTARAATSGSGSADQQLRAFLEETSLADVAALAGKGKAPTPPLAAVESDEPIANLLTLLAARRVLAAPVAIRSSADPPGAAALARGGVPVKAVAGFVSAADVVDAVLREVGEGTDSAALAAAAEAVCARPVGSLLVSGGGGAAAAGATTVGAVREATAGRDWGLVHGPASSTSLLDALAFHFFRDGPAGGPRLPVHRLGLTDGASLTGLLSMSDVVAALAAAPAADGGAWGPAAGTAVDALLPPPRPVVSVPATATALEAFQAMRAAGVPGVAVVDGAAGGRLVAHLSASDARCLTVATFPALALNVLAFLAERPLLASAALDTAGGAGGVADAVARAAAAGVALLGDDPARAHARAGRLLDAVPGLGLRAACAALAATRVHQLYEVDPATGAPARVLSASDVLAAVLAAAGGVPE